MAITDQQRTARRNGIGASECAAICGVDPYMSAYDLWLLKTGKVEPEPENELMEIGNAMELAIAPLAAKRLGKPLVKPTGTYKHENGIMFANLDRQVEKAQRGFPLCEIKDTGLVDGWGEPGTDQVPDKVIVQVHAQMICSDARVGHVAAMLTRFTRTLSMFKIAYSIDLARSVEDRVCKFWDQNVLKDIPPEDSVPSLDFSSRVNRTNGKVMEVDDVVIVAFDAARRARLDAEKAEDAARAALMAQLIDGDVAMSEAHVLIYGLVNQQRFDQKAFREENPEAAAKYMRDGSYRKFGKVKGCV